MERLGLYRWIANHENIIITGPTGVGKTWIACAMADKACREDHSALYLRVLRMLLDFHVARADGSYPNLMARLSKIEVLILDDWGLSPLSRTLRP
jgi:DNA replication protein DnaC